MSRVGEVAHLRLLGFFALALLIVEAFLTTVLLGGKLAAHQKLIGVWIGAGMFVLVVAFVFALAWSRPGSLIYDKEAKLISEGKIPFGTDGHLIRPDLRFEDK